MTVSKDNYKEHGGAMTFLAKLVKYLEDHNGGKLFTIKEAELLARQQKKTPGQVYGSVPWYLEKAQWYLETYGVVLPGFMTIPQHSTGEKTLIFPTGLCRNGKPILSEEKSIPVIFSNPELQAKKNNARSLSSELNKTYFGPTAARLREILLEHEARVRQATIDEANGTNQGGKAPPQAGIDPELIVPEGETKTSTANLYRVSLQQDAKFSENINNAIDLKKAAQLGINDAISGLRENGQGLRDTAHKLDENGRRLELALNASVANRNDADGTIALLEAQRNNNRIMQEATLFPVQEDVNGEEHLEQREEDRVQDVELDDVHNGEQMQDHGRQDIVADHVEIDEVPPSTPEQQPVRRMETRSTRRRRQQRNA